MTHFEYITVAISLVLTFTAARLLSGVSPLIAATHRSPLHLLWLTTLSVELTLFWWVFWDLRVIETWTLLLFLELMAYVFVIYIVATLLIPEEPAAVRDWDRHFFAIRRPLFVLLLLRFGAVVLVSLQIGFRFVPEGSIAEIASLLPVPLLVVGLLFARRGVQGFVALAYLLCVLVQNAPRFQGWQGSVGA